MIVRLIRPEGGQGPWMLYAPGGVAGFIHPTPALQRAMEGRSGYFHAEHADDRDAWDIGRRAPDQAW
jgi:hypothetical protein